MNKPFEVYVEDKLIYSNLAPLHDENGPLLVQTSMWWGEPNEEHIKRLNDAIVST